jgi:DNA polymerase-4
VSEHGSLESDAGFRTIIHVDMDAFYAAVEQRDHPELRGRPVIVGSDPKGGKGRGIVATCSYEARKFGVRSALPISRAWRLCPHGTYVRPDMEKYERTSGRVMAILLDFSDLVEQISIDEAFLDVTGCYRLLGGGVEIARKIKQRIRGELQLTASVGVASNKFVAKVASDLEKPDGLVVVESGREKEFLAPLPVSRLWGVGARTETQLKEMGLEYIGQLADLTRSGLTKRFGKGGEHLWLLAQGIDVRPVTPEEGYKSIGHEITFERDTADSGLLHGTLLELTEKVCQRLRAHSARARTITIKFREADFTTRTRRTTLGSSVDTAEKIFPVALRMLRSLQRKERLVRLIGVYASNLETDETGVQLNLFDRTSPKDRKLATALDDIVRRYGEGSITRAALVEPKKRI